MFANLAGSTTNRHSLKEEEKWEQWLRVVQAQCQREWPRMKVGPIHIYFNRYFPWCASREGKVLLNDELA